MAIVVTDSPSLIILTPGTINVIDQITVLDNDNIARQSVAIIVTDTPTLVIVSGPLVSPSDSTPATDTLVEVYLTSYFDNDVIMVNESVSFIFAVQVIASDITTVSATPQLLTGTFLAVLASDTVTITDTPSINANLGNISKSDTVTVGEVPIILLIQTPGGINVLDFTVVSDTPSVFIPILTLSVSDSTTVTDTPQFAFISSSLSVVDSITVSDTTIVVTAYQAVVDGDPLDTAVVDEIVTMQILFPISVIDQTTLTDSPALSVSIIGPLEITSCPC